jgi:hypothetical protein
MRKPLAPFPVCDIRGPYLPVGDTDWYCRAHNVDAELRNPPYDPKRGGRSQFYCPVGQNPDGTNK